MKLWYIWKKKNWMQNRAINRGFPHVEALYVDGKLFHWQIRVCFTVHENVQAMNMLCYASGRQFYQTYRLILLLSKHIADTAAFNFNNVGFNLFKLHWLHMRALIKLMPEVTNYHLTYTVEIILQCKTSFMRVQEN